MRAIACALVACHVTSLVYCCACTQHVQRSQILCTHIMCARSLCHEMSSCVRFVLRRRSCSVNYWSLKSRHSNYQRNCCRRRSRSLRSRSDRRKYRLSRRRHRKVGRLCFSAYKIHIIFNKLRVHSDTHTLPLCHAEGLQSWG